LEDIGILMNFIDEEFPEIPQVMLDPTLAQEQQNFPVHVHFLTNTLEAPVMETLKGILEEWYH
jgi:hypothetical protein